jgi:hypothetical protein
LSTEPTEPLAPERKALMAARLAWMMSIAVGTPFLCLALIANALIPCANDVACKGKRGWLLAGLALLLTAAAGLLARRRVKAALDKAGLDA